MCKSRSNFSFSVYLVHLRGLSVLIFNYLKESEGISMVPGNKYFWFYNQIYSKFLRLLRYIFCYGESFQRSDFIIYHNILPYFLLLQMDLFLHLCMVLLGHNYQPFC